MGKELKLRAVKRGFRRDGVNIFADLIDMEVRKSFAGEPLTFRETTDDDMVAPDIPICFINETATQQLMDDLWDCGLRPSEGSGSAGALAATQKHLEDMRKIAGKKLGVEFK